MQSIIPIIPSRSLFQFHKWSSWFLLNNSNIDEALPLQALIWLPSLWLPPLKPTLLWEKLLFHLNIKRWLLNTSSPKLTSNHSQSMPRCRIRLSIRLRARTVPTSKLHSNERALTQHQFLKKASDKKQYLRVKLLELVLYTCHLLESSVPFFINQEQLQPIISSSRFS